MLGGFRWAVWRTEWTWRALKGSGAPSWAESTHTASKNGEGAQKEDKHCAGRDGGWVGRWGGGGGLESFRKIQGLRVARVDCGLGYTATRRGPVLVQKGPLKGHLCCFRG